MGRQGRRVEEIDKGKDKKEAEFERLHGGSIELDVSVSPSYF
jgi:hypothetical protein